MNMKSENEETNENKCSFCLKHFKTLKTLSQHEQTHFKIKPKKCRQCPGMIFNTNDEYFIHLNKLHQRKRIDCFICSECGKQFKTKSELTNHINSKCGTIKLYKCEVCSQELMTPGSLYNHMLRHKGQPSFMCRFCAKLFLTAGQLKIHERIHTQEKVFVCNICGKGFCHRQSLITHSTLHTGIKPYLCENCGHSFSCVGNLLKHRKTHTDCGLTPLTTHRVINPLTKMKVKVNTPANSKLKQIEVHKELQKTLEQSTETTIKPHNDNVANETVSNTTGSKISDDKIESEESSSVIPIITERNVKDDYQEYGHQNTNSLLTTPVSDKMKNLSPKRFKVTKQELKQFVKERGIQYGEDLTCKYCDKVYSEPRWLLRHEKEYHGLSSISEDSIETLKDSNKDCIMANDDNSETYKCSCCKESFTDKEECKNHQIHSHAEMLTCQDCDKIFSNLDSLRSHKNTFHKGVPRKTYTYVCERCGKQFKQKSALLHHEQNNCGAEPLIQCHVCGKNFSSVHVRKSHMRIHNAEKKLLCKFCGKSFHWKGQLKIHERSHTGEKPFTCLYCPKAFAYRESLITHSSLHTGIKPHLCEACGSRFSCIGNLIKHRTTHASTCGVWYTKNKRECT